MNNQNGDSIVGTAAAKSQEENMGVNVHVVHSKVSLFLERNFRYARMHCGTTICNEYETRGLLVIVYSRLIYIFSLPELPRSTC